MTYCTFLAKRKQPWVLIAHRPIVKQDIPEGVLRLDLDGYSMTNLEGLYQEFTTVLKLPKYFGRNLNALDECLNDLEWLPSDGYLLCIKNAEVLLKDETDDVFEGLLSILNSAGEEWATPVTLGEAWDREGLPFHTILELGKSYSSGFQKKLSQLEFEVFEIS